MLAQLLLSQDIINAANEGLHHLCFVLKNIAPSCHLLHPRHEYVIARTTTLARVRLSSNAYSVWRNLWELRLSFAKEMPARGLSVKGLPASSCPWQSAPISVTVLLEP